MRGNDETVERFEMVNMCMIELVLYNLTFALRPAPSNNSNMAYTVFEYL